MVRERSLKNRGGCLRPALLGIVAVGVLLGLIGIFYPGPKPQVEIQPGLKGIGRAATLRLRVSKPQRMERLRVEVVQGSEAKPAFERTFEPAPLWKVWASGRPVEEVVEVGWGTVKGLRAGEATLRVTAERAGMIFRTPAPVVAEQTLPVRLSPPSLQVVSTFHYVNQGGSEAVVYRAGESAVRSGVQAGSWFFPGAPMPGGDPQLRFALFAIPYDMGDAGGVRLIAEDEVANRSELPFIDRFTPRPLHTDTIPVDDKFFAKVVPEIRSNTPELEDKGTPLDTYLEINRNLRKVNAARLRELARSSESKFLWHEPFLPMPNAAITAAFADRRTYLYNGRPVDQQDHLGFDMASVEHDKIPASNAGKVVLARYFGIYGNAVVIDHGYGLMSLYGHLSQIEVKEGEMVQRGQEIGRSGQTGLAGGDHLHFTMLLQGLAVTPVEWWDPHWLQDRIARKLGAAFPYTPG
jgi:murein DD-endopeptidase MepM/ murein hydrolase activator NlpD